MPGGTSRYRRVGNGGPSVDESLFGGSGSNTARKTPRGAVATDPSAASVVLTRSALDKIYETSTIKTEAQEMAERDERERIRAQKEHLARSRKAKMIALSENSKKNMKKSDIEVANAARAAQLRKMGSDQMDKNSDVYKLMATLGARASAFTIRDQQLIDKKQREEQEREYERRMDTIMEIDRLADLKRRENDEAEKKFNRMQDRKVLIDQIKMRERARMLAEEAKEQESMQIKAKMSKYKDEDAEIARLRAIEQEKSRAEVMKANEAAIAKKLADREFEKKEIAEILLYQAEMDAKMAAREAEEEAVAKAKAERQKQLLAMQEKSQNKQAELDELRARRATEEKERIARKKEKDEALKRRNDTITLLAERKKQEEDKQRHKQMEADREYREHKAQLEYSMRTAGREDAERKAKHDANYRHRDLLLNQIHGDEERKKQGRGDDLQEGRKFHQALVSDEAKFSAIRDQMVADLLKKGVNPAYLSEMKHLDVGKILKR